MKRNKWVKGRLYCDASEAQKDAENALTGGFKATCNEAYSNISAVQDRYDQETEHGTNGTRQQEWQRKYS